MELISERELATAELEQGPRIVAALEHEGGSAAELAATWEEERAAALWLGNRVRDPHGELGTIARIYPDQGRILATVEYDEPQWDDQTELDWVADDLEWV